VKLKHLFFILLFISSLQNMQYAVVDYLWYRRKVPGADADSQGFDVIDQWGRMMPDPDRWPSSRGGNGFTEVANKVHSMGLKFGIHVMRGISTQAVNDNSPILDTTTVCSFYSRFHMLIFLLLAQSLLVY